MGIFGHPTKLVALAKTVSVWSSHHHQHSIYCSNCQTAVTVTIQIVEKKLLSTVKTSTVKH